ncbi:MAG: DUF5117 domain-containing protein, partial [Gemmatimonadota bacterium]|nr:DUF5117 domain-containing protein [Gemmatimonadota bacterium]
MARHPLPLLPLLPLLAALIPTTPAVAQLPAIAEYTGGMERQDGFFPIHWDGKTGRLLMEVRLDEEFLYLTSLATGLGSAELGLDRGTIGGEYIAHFTRVGPRVQLVLANPQFRAVSDNAALARSVTESFPTSVAAAFEILAGEDGRVLVDVTPLAMSDVMDAVGSLRRAEQGAFRLDRDRSSVYAPRTKAFPRNTEIEASITFTSDNPGRLVRS